MKSITSKVSYLKGLIEGLEVKEDSKEGKIISVMSDILQDIAYEVEDMKESQSIIQEYVDTIDQDLLSLQEDFYDEDEDEDFLEDFMGIECPMCDETIYIDKDVFGGKANICCPNCHKEISLNNICSCDYECEELKNKND
ncbi:TPA: hypothetical protein LA742_001859 [Clostridium botulinum]|uniref:AraC family transcriptional regulator n=3 Tax=Clostridium TaxID=1485 RepID=A0A1J1CVB8_CLOSG|nr:MULTISPECIES: CD1247 N-terminal domain-containing protein [Clostridium]MBE6075991.1 hypothetical protein [Clostridium lundense]APF26016.1 hypothetical protein NPD7_1121 [Clostridium sporogenes]APH13422.1 hypothetical protein NPD5_130 [Clostridium sporogenes]AUM95714.1 hypothetical protein RSJ11_11325 [Clostridium sporogenes]AVQ40131.1 hypothetical protein C7M56_16150 [Clostridium botulinum]